MTKFTVGTALFAGLLALAGCDKAAETKPTDAKAAKAEPKTPKGVHTHDDWWCDEHGVQEAECSMCNSKVAKAFQAKGDWCKEHARAKSQCFLCDPKLKEKFAAEYAAKYGKQPPEPEGQQPDGK